MRPLDITARGPLCPATRAGFFAAALVTCSALPAPRPVSAQVNIEALRPEEPPAGRSGSLGGDLTIRSGNVDFVEVGLEGRLFDVRQSLTTLIVGNGGLGFLGSSRFASSGLGHFRQTYRYRPRVSPEWFAQADYDRARLLTFRMVVGAGVRSPLASGDWGHFDVGSALMIEREWLDLPDDAVHLDRTSDLRWSTFVTFRWAPTETLVITSTTYAQPQFDNVNDTRLLENLRLATAVTRTLSLTISFDARYDSRPPDGIAVLDTTLRTGVSYAY